MLKIRILQKSGCCIFIGRRSLHIGNTIFNQSLPGTCIRKIVCLVGRSIYSGECAWRSGAESYSLDRGYRGKEHAEAHSFAIHINLDVTVGNRKNSLDMISLSRLILHHIPETRTALGTENTIGSQFQPRTGNAVLIQKVNLKRTFIILSGLQIKGDFQLFGSRNFTFHLCIIKRIFILQA